MQKDNLFERLTSLHSLIYRVRNYLTNLDKINKACSNLSKDSLDVMFTFYSRYGNASIIICKDYFSYENDRLSFSLHIKKDIRELDYYEDNALREIELYFYRIYGIPKKPTFKDKLIKFIKEFFNVPGISKKILFSKRTSRRL